MVSKIVKYSIFLRPEEAMLWTWQKSVPNSENFCFREKKNWTQLNLYNTKYVYKTETSGDSDRQIMSVPAVLHDVSNKPKRN